MILRYLEDAKLLKVEKSKQENGASISTYSEIVTYRVMRQEITDEISASVYGSNINQMYRVSSPLQDLEEYLQEKLNNGSDNISKYFISLSDVKYKIVSVKKNWVDIERI